MGVGLTCGSSANRKGATMTLSLTLFSTESSKTKRSVTPSHSYLLGVWLGAFAGLVAWFAGAALSVYAWLINDDALQRRGTWTMCLMFPSFWLVAYCLDRYEKQNGDQDE